MDVADQLLHETEKWTDRFDERITEVAATSDQGADILTNARAYRQDTEHFLEEDDLVRAFEAIVWAWSWLEIGEELDVLEE